MADAKVRHEEEWRPVVGYEGLYEVSDRGRVRSLPRLRKGPKHCPEGIMWPGKMRTPVMVKGYERVVLFKKGKRKNQMIHRLVATAFLGAPPEADFVVNHKNTVKTDNRPSNLEWVTVAENAAHAAENGLLPKGSEAVHSALHESQVWFILGFTDEPRPYKCAESLAEMFGVAHSSIYSIWNGNSWAHL